MRGKVFSVFLSIQNSNNNTLWETLWCLQQGKIQSHESFLQVPFATFLLFAMLVPIQRIKVAACKILKNRKKSYHLHTKKYIHADLIWKNIINTAIPLGMSQSEKKSNECPRLNVLKQTNLILCTPFALPASV